MSSLPHARSFRDLLVYQKSLALSKEIFKLTTRLLEMKFILSHRKFADHLALWEHKLPKLGIAVDCGYLTREDANLLLERCSEIGRLLGGMMSKADLFCKPDAISLREDQAEYFIVSDN